MRIASISDIHGNPDALDAVLSAIKKEAPDRLAVLGDLAAFGPEPSEVVDRIRDLSEALVIQGNTDRYVLEMDSPNSDQIWEAIWWTKGQLAAEQIQYLGSLQQMETIQADKVSILFCHADPISDDGGFFLKDEAAFAEKIAQATEKVVVCGHTHVPMWRPIGEQILVNDGSAGFPYDGDPCPSYVVIDTKGDEVSDIRIERVEYNTKSISHRLNAISLPMARLMAERVLMGEMLQYPKKIQ